MPLTNHQVRLAARPSGLPRATDWSLTTEEVPEPAEGQFVVAVSHLSVDPAMRGWMNAGASYIPPVEIGAVMRAGAVGRVTASAHPGFAVGDDVYGMFGVQEYAASDGRGVTKIDTSLAGPSTYLGALGATGLTAYFGLLDTGRLKEGDTVVVSGAAGAVGSMAGQIAKIKGAGRVIGIAGGPEKCRALTEEFGFDVGVDHRADDFRERLADAVPVGIDVYFENVGGAVFGAVRKHLNLYARIPVCGLVSGYNDTEPPGGPDRMPGLMRQVLTKSLTIRGFIQGEFVPGHYRDFLRDMSGWVRDGSVRYREDVTDGLDNAPEAFAGMLRGANFGKVLVKVS